MSLKKIVCCALLSFTFLQNPVFAAGAVSKVVGDIANRVDEAFKVLFPPPGYAATKHPIVLVHGLFGFNNIGPVDYWFRIPSELRRSGATVYLVQVSALNSTEVRGEQLVAELRRLSAATGHKKFNLMGHSHGGPTIRYAASVSKDLVASVTTLQGVNHGSKMADFVLNASGATGTTPIVSALAKGLATVASVLSGRPSLPQDAIPAAKALSVGGSLDFNKRFPDGKLYSPCTRGDQLVNGVHYFSMGGAKPLTNFLDPVDYVLLAVTAITGDGANDGLVSSCSSRWGNVIRADYPWNHLDAINHTFGLRQPLTPDPIFFYTSHANRLKNIGL
jgi:triacylglycerol lipase